MQGRYRGDIGEMCVGLVEDGAQVEAAPEP
jgi:hypothetical protein